MAARQPRAVEEARAVSEVVAAQALEVEIIVNNPTTWTETREILEEAVAMVAMDSIVEVIIVG